MDVGALVVSIKNLNDDLKLNVILPDGELVEASTQQYVVDGDYFMFAKVDGLQHYETINTIGGLKHNLEYEASDSCWRTNGDLFDGAKSDFLDCIVYIVTGDYEAFLNATGEGYECYEIHVVEPNIVDGVVYMSCTEPAYEDSEDENLVEKIEVKVEGGRLVATKSFDPAYPGINIEFIADDDADADEKLSNPRVLMEKSAGNPLRALIWGNDKVEDYTADIRFE